MACTSCGAALRPGAMFCGECGQKVVQVATVAPALVPPPPPPPAFVTTPIAPPPPPPPPPVVAAPIAPPPPPPPVVTAPAAVPPPPPPPVSAPPVVDAPVAAPVHPTAFQPTVPVAGLVSSIPKSITEPVQPIPAPAPIEQPAPVAAIDFESDLDEDFDRTILAPRRGPAWTITGPDGVSHSIRVATVIGRNPQRPSTRPGIEILALVDTTKSLSKSHAIVEPDGDVFTIEDLGSTNGIIIVGADGTEIEVPTGRRVPVDKGTVLEFGDYVLTIGRG